MQISSWLEFRKIPQKMHWSSILYLVTFVATGCGIVYCDDKEEYETFNPCNSDPINGLLYAHERASQSVFVFRGNHFYKFDYKTGKIQGAIKHINEVYEEVDVPITAVTEVPIGEKFSGLMFIKDKNYWIYNMTKIGGHAILVDEGKISNPEKATNTEITGMQVDQNKLETVFLCEGKTYYTCSISFNPTVKISKCVVVPEFRSKMNEESCNGISTVKRQRENEEEEYLIAGDDNLVLLSKKEGAVQVKSRQRIQEKLSKCKSYMIYYVGGAIGVGITVMLLANVTYIAIYVSRKKKRVQNVEDVTTMASQEGVTRDENLKSALHSKRGNLKTPKVNSSNI